MFWKKTNKRLDMFGIYVDINVFVQQDDSLYHLKFQDYIIYWIEHSGQKSPHTLIKKRRGGLRLKKLDYTFEQLDIFLDSKQAELIISTAMLTSLLDRKLLTQQEYNDCVSKIKQLYTA